MRTNQTLVTMLVGSVASLVVPGCGSGGDRAAPPATGVLEANAVVERVVDGDTIDADIGGRAERVRLIGIDTPEIAHEAFDDRPANDTECYGDEAHAFTATLLPAGTEVRLERDVVGRDDYGRILAYVHRASDGIFVNFELVRQGYAVPLTFPPNVAHAERMVDAARRAERDDVGLWAGCATSAG
jgi:micrococcal nuclease